MSEKIFLKDTHKNTPSNSLLSEGALQKLTEVPLHDLWKLNKQVIKYLNQTDEPSSMYAPARIQCCKYRVAPDMAMTGLRTMILPYGAGGEPGRGETPMRL